MTLPSLCIPEILEHVAKHLLPKDVLNCLLVSKEFHATMIRCLWKTVKVYNYRARGSPLQFPLGDVLHRYKHHIQRLEFLDNYPPPYLTLRGCSCLQILKIKTTQLDRDFLPEFSSDYQDRILFGFAGLIVAHASTLRDITVQLSPRHMFAPSKDLWEALLECSGLKRLELSFIRVSDDLRPLFLQVCAKPQALILSSIDVSGWPTTMSDFTLTGPRYLSITKHPKDHLVSTISYYDQATLIRHCPNLESLYWRRGGARLSNTPQNDRNIATFYTTLAMDPWPLLHLETLDLSWTTVTDRDMAAVLREMYQLKILKAVGTGFGELCFQAIVEDRVEMTGTHKSMAQPSKQPDLTCYERRLCDSIQVLWINDCSSVTSKMIQTVLESCPRLTQLYADTVTLTDIAQGQEWVCLEMRDLQLYLEADVKVSYHHDDATLESGPFAEMQWGVYGQLATLKRLERLHLTNHLRRTVEKRTLDLRLKAGMELLVGWTHLKELTFVFDDHQQIGVDEARWIRQFWPRLRTFKGYPNDDESVRELIRDILQPVAIDDTPRER
ncbi:hypothetical protein B0O80DRAFT_440971 [Mortierella sp. GBAus27b]|nr:hypothetical protein BGX31_003615 [Mortierella sp. GBA43]KAI8359744.1 hypothetical protein B0O80DRAFT_440971 [Mortierella sp. GBAus27b]